MKSQNQNKRVSVLAHILGWSMLSTVLLLLSPLSWKIDVPVEFWWKQTFLGIILMLSFYVNMFFLVPRYLLVGRIYTYIAIILSGALIFIFVLISFENLIHLPELFHKVFNPGKPYVPSSRRLSSDITHLMFYLLTIGISTSVSSVQKWQRDENLRRELDQQRINTELSFLKAQINPHFFFNTLNNIYALTNIDIEKSQEALLKLSRMMRYVLYENQKDQTILSKEINFIKDYIELMKMRLSEKVKLEIQIAQLKEDLIVAPMLLLPFLENSFKHGVSTQQDCTLLIKLEVMGNTLFFETRNHIFPIHPESPEAKENGIGLANTQRRLELLYPNKHRLKFGKDETNEEYWVNLTIDLA